MPNLHSMNPFAKREENTPAAVITYKVLTILTWLLSVITSIYYSTYEPRDGFHLRQRIQDQNWLHVSGFTMNNILMDIYWIVLFVFQAGYIGHLFASKVETVNAACAVGSHFIFNNLLHFAFVMLFVRSHFVWAEVILVINFFNLSSLYFRHNVYPRFIHIPAVSGPLAWTFVAIYWNGAIMVPYEGSLVARIFANIFICSVLVYGGFFITVYKDYTMGFALSVLSAAIGVAQFERQVIAFQWIFAFVIMSVLFVATVVVAVPAATGRGFSFGREAPPAVDNERAPLLADP